MKTPLISAIALALTSSAATADVVYDNLGPMDDYELVTGWVVTDGPPFGTATEQAMPFSPSTSGDLEKIEFAMTMVGGPAMASISVDVYSDAPGNPLASLVASSLTTTIGTNPAAPQTPLHTVTFPGALPLTAGQIYWVVIASTAPLNGNFLVWNQNVVGDNGNVADRRNGGPAWNVFSNQNLGAFRVSTADAMGLGTNYCGPGVANSSGMSGTISAMGSASAAANNLTLEAGGMPTNQFGIFVASQTQAFVPTAGGTSNGNLCLGGAIGRFNRAGQILGTGAAGAFSLNVDLTMIPQGNGSVTAMSGESWNFQAWHRDGVGLGSNFTDGLEIVFL